MTRRQIGFWLMALHKSRIDSDYNDGLLITKKETTVRVGEAVKASEALKRIS